MNLDTQTIADRIDSIDAAAVARHQAMAFHLQDEPAMPAKPAGSPPLVRLGPGGDFVREID